MRILHVDRQRHWTGQQARTWQTVRHLLLRGHEAIIACEPGSEYERRAAREGVRAVPIRMRRTPLFAVPRLARLLGRERIDLVDAHGAVDHQLAAVAAQLAGRPTVVRTKHKDVGLHSGFFSRVVYRRPLTHKVVAISDAVRRQLIRDGVPEAQVELIYTAVDVDRFREPGRGRERERAEMRRGHGIAADDFLVGGASRLHHSKGVDVLLRALARLHAAAGRPAPVRYRYIHVGSGPAAKYVEIARGAGLPEGAALFPGPVEDVERFYAGLDLFCLPSRTEGLGTVLLEAMASGLPAVATRVGGVPEAVVDGVTGRLVPPEDPDALASAIASLAADAERRAGYGAAARRRAVERFGARTMLEATERLYLRLAEERGGARVRV